MIKRQKQIRIPEKSDILGIERKYEYGHTKGDG